MNNNKKTTKTRKHKIKDITDDVIETSGALLETSGVDVDKATSQAPTASTKAATETTNEDDEAQVMPTIAEEKKNKQKLAEDKNFKCPVCHTVLAYGTKVCPNCGSKIFYRDMSHTFWNERKIKLLQQSGAITHE